MLNMKKKGVDKKAASPLIATVVITSFVVVAVMLITFWGKGVQEDLQSKQGGIAAARLSCTGIDIEVTNTAGGSVTLENNGPDIDGIILVVKGDGESQTQLYKQSVQRGNSRSFPYANIPGVPLVEELSVIVAMGEGIYRPCSDQKIDIEL